MKSRFNLAFIPGLQRVFTSANLNPTFDNVAPPSPNAASLAKFANVPVRPSTGVPAVNVPIFTWDGKNFGEGSAIEDAAPLSGPVFNEGKGKPFGAHDIRFTAKGKVLYAIPMGWPDGGELVIKSLDSDNPALARVNSITLLGHGAIKDFSRDAKGLKIRLPAGKPALSYTYVLKIS